MAEVTTRWTLVRVLPFAAGAVFLACPQPLGEGQVANVLIEDTVREVTDDGEVYRPFDYPADAGLTVMTLEGEAYVPQVLTPLGGGAYGVNFSPEAGWYVTYGKTMVEAAGPRVDLGYGVLGRSDAVRSVAYDTTGLALEIGNLEAWDPRDDLELYSSNVGDGIFYVEDFLGGELTPGATQIDDDLYTANWGFPLLDAAKGDDAWLTQLTWRNGSPDGGVGHRALARAVRLTPTQTDKTFTPVSALLQPLVANDQIAVQLRPQAFVDAVSQGNPQGTPRYSWFGLSVQPGGLQDGQISATADLALIDLEADAGVTEVTQEIIFANPFPRDWPEMVSAGASVSRRYLAAFADTGLTRYARVTVETTRSELAKGPIVPLVSPPREVKIANQAADGQTLFGEPLAGVGFTPTVSWQKPALGDPTRYEVRVRRLFNDEGYTSLSHEWTAVIRGTRVTLPPGILKSGEEYMIEVIAVVHAGGTLPHAPFRDPLPHGTATTMTNVFTP